MNDDDDDDVADKVLTMVLISLGVGILLSMILLGIAFVALAFLRVY